MIRRRPTVDDICTECADKPELEKAVRALADGLRAAGEEGDFMRYEKKIEAFRQTMHFQHRQSLGEVLLGRILKALEYEPPRGRGGRT